MPYFSFNRNWRQGMCHEEVFYFRQETSIEVELLFGKLEFSKFQGLKEKKKGSHLEQASSSRHGPGCSKLGWISLGQHEI